MHSRAFMLLRRDLVNLQRFPIAGVTALPTRSDSLFHWSATIEGLSGTSWEGAIFQVTLTFSEEFNSKPPEVHFMTIPFHPNIDPQRGTPSCNLLGPGWSEDCTVTSVLLALQALLASPELDGGCVLNLGAASLLRSAPHAYRQMVLDCVTASLRVDAGLQPYEAVEAQTESRAAGDVSLPSTPASPGMQRLRSSRRRRRRSQLAKPISFDDYHTLWKGIATSVTTYRQPNIFIQLLERDSHLHSVHCRTTDAEQSMHTDKQIEQQKLMRNGDLHTRRRVPKVTPRNRVHRMEALRQLYRDATNPETDGGVSGEAGGTTTAGDDVEELVEWTRNLDHQELST